MKVIERRIFALEERQASIPEVVHWRPQEVARRLAFILTAIADAEPGSPERVVAERMARLLNSAPTS